MDSPTGSLTTLYAVLFTLVGPIKALSVFHARTIGMEQRARTALALKGAALGALGIAVAALMGTAQIQKYGVSQHALATASGLVLAIVGLLPLVGLEKAAAAPNEAPGPLALAFPILLPPYAFGLILLFTLKLPTAEGRTGIILVGAVIMAINAVAMILSGPWMRHVGMTPLKIIGAVFGILQLALGIQLMFWGIPRGLAPIS